MLAPVLADMPTWLPWLLMSGGGAIVLVVVLYATLRRSGAPGARLPWERWQRARPQSDAPQATPHFPKPGAAKPTQPAPDLDALHRLAREVMADLDARAQRLEALTAAADQRIAELRVLTQAGTPPARLHAPARAGGAMGSAPADRTDDQATGPDALSTRILALAEQGHTPVQIAQRLGQGVGTVELVLALNR